MVVDIPFILPACGRYLGTDVCLLVRIVRFPMDGMQHNGERCDGGKQQSADVGGSGDFAVKLQLIERFGRNCFGENGVKAIGQWPKDHVGEENREGKHKRQMKEPSPVSAPIAAEHQIVAAVLSPRTFAPSLKMTPAPRKPTPDTT